MRTSNTPRNEKLLWWTLLINTVKRSDTLREHGLRKKPQPRCGSSRNLVLIKVAPQPTELIRSQPSNLISSRHGECVEQPLRMLSKACDDTVRIGEVSVNAPYDPGHQFMSTNTHSHSAQNRAWMLANAPEGPRTSPGCHAPVLAGAPRGAVNSKTTPVTSAAPPTPNAIFETHACRFA